MGDFAAGKMLVNGVEISPVSVADFDQFVGDVDGNQEFINSVEGAGPSPSPAAEELLAAGVAVPDQPSELLMCLKQWRDVGLHLYVVGSSYSIRDAEAILGNAGEDLFVIGDDMDGGVLLMGRDGVLFTADPEQPAVEVGCSRAGGGRLPRRWEEEGGARVMWRLRPRQAGRGGVFSCGGAAASNSGTLVRSSVGVVARRV